MILADQITDIFDTIQKGGIIGLLLIILVGGMRGWWVWGWLYRQERKEKEEWRALALRGTRQTEDAADALAELAAKKKGDGLL